MPKPTPNTEDLADVPEIDRLRGQLAKCAAATRNLRAQVAALQAEVAKLKSTPTK